MAPPSRDPPRTMPRRFDGIGAVAQLGERYNGIVEVSGSIPLSSTITTQKVPSSGAFLFVRGEAPHFGSLSEMIEPLILFWRDDCLRQSASFRKRAKPLANESQPPAELHCQNKGVWRNPYSFTRPSSCFCRKATVRVRASFPFLAVILDPKPWDSPG